MEIKKYENDCQKFEIFLPLSMIICTNSLSYVMNPVGHKFQTNIYLHEIFTQVKICGKQPKWQIRKRATVSNALSFPICRIFLSVPNFSFKFRLCTKPIACIFFCLNMQIPCKRTKVNLNAFIYQWFFVCLFCRSLSTSDAHGNDWKFVFNLRHVNYDVVLLSHYRAFDRFVNWAVSFIRSHFLFLVIGCTVKHWISQWTEWKIMFIACITGIYLFLESNMMWFNA